MKERSTGKLWLPLMAACLLMMGIFSLSVSTKAADNDSSAPEIPGLTFQSEMQNEFAECFHIYYYNDDYTLIDVPDSGQFLLVPEGKSAPDGLDEDIVVLQKPLDNIYLAATSAMSLFSSLDALDDIKFSSLQASGWYVDAAKQAMENGDIVFAGKYSEPDYELLVNSGCNLAIESTMILHTPKVQEMIEQMGIPVFTDRSSYENHPLGRTEWIKVYAEMVDKRDEAKEFFDEQAKIIPGNIKQGVSILGVEGTYGGEAVKAQPNKNVTPTMAQQIITPDAEYDYLAQVTVAAIPITYTDNAAGGQTLAVGA
mgnify:CR=1 FL=1